MDSSTRTHVLIIKTITVGWLETNCYLVLSEDSGDCLIVDPAAEPEKILTALKTLNRNSTKPKVSGIVNTHGHPDHTGANMQIKKEFSCPIYVHQLDGPLLVSTAQSISASPDGPLLVSPAQNHPASPADVLVKEGDILPNNLRVIHTPGHTPGSICLVGNNFVLSGDTLFCGSVGRWDLPGGDERTLMRSLKKLTKLPAHFIFYPGHGPSCTIGNELKHNPFLQV